MIHRLFGALSLLALTGCVLGPDYHVPEAAKINDPAAQGRFLAPADDVLSPAPVPGKWWRLFEDERLNELEIEALAANTDLKIATANLARAQAVYAETIGHREVRGAAEFEVARAQSSGEDHLIPIRPPVSDVGAGAISLSYDLDLFGRLKRAIEAADADKDASAAGLDLARVAVAADVARAYIETCAAGEDIAIARRQVLLQQEILKLITRLKEQGKSAATEVTQAAARVEQSRASISVFETKRQVSLFRLAALTGHAPADFPRDLEACTALPRIARPVPVGDGVSLLRRRPDIRQAERILAGANARIGMATAALYPDIALGASIGSIGRLSDFGSPAAATWSLSSIITWTFPTAYEQARVDQASAATRAALARFDGVVLNALRETETSLAAYLNDRKRADALHAAHRLSSQAVGEADALRHAGRSPYINGLNAGVSLAQAEQAMAGAKAQLSLDQVNIFLALGGGWTDDQ